MATRGRARKFPIALIHHMVDFVSKPATVCLRFVFTFQDQRETGNTWLSLEASKKRIKDEGRMLGLRVR